MFSMTRKFSALFLIMLFSDVTIAESASKGVSNPEVTIASGGKGKALTVNNFDDVELIGYEMQEFFLSGEAHSFSAGKLLLPGDGKWDSVSKDEDTEPYKVRAVVYTPKDADRFSGTVYVEWQNVSGLVEAAPDWIHSHVEVSRQGAAYVLASVQSVGTMWLQSDDPWWLPETDLVVSDPVRYQSLNHPGDDYAFDIYSQLGQAILDGKLMGELKAEQLIAIGESQSAGWLTSYVNGIQKIANIYDGFLIHSSFGFGPGLGLVSFTEIRDDLVPVILFQAETDVRLADGRTRQAEREEGMFRLWEVAGTAHYDAYGLNAGTSDIGDGESEVVALGYLREPVKKAQVEVMQCEKGINSGPMHWTFNAALNWIDRWVRDGTPPPIAPRLEIEDSWWLLEFKKDKHGNSLGGIRSPLVDTPLAVLSGSGNGRGEGAPMISYFCGIFGETIPFSEEKIKQLYPAQEVFVQQFSRSAMEAVKAGFLLPADAELLINAAKRHELYPELAEEKVKTENAGEVNSPE